jgi:hypothetical protein
MSPGTAIIIVAMSPLCLLANAAEKEMTAACLCLSGDLVFTWDESCRIISCRAGRSRSIGCGREKSKSIQIRSS